jgi:hypothetical protein
MRLALDSPPRGVTSATPFDAGLQDAAGLHACGAAITRAGVGPLAASPGRPGQATGAIRDVALIALAWMILIGVIVYPVAQLIGILTCAIALVLGKPRPQ